MRSAGDEVEGEARHLGDESEVDGVCVDADTGAGLAPLLDEAAQTDAHRAQVPSKGSSHRGHDLGRTIGDLSGPSLAQNRPGDRMKSAEGESARVGSAAVRRELHRR